MAIPFSWVTFLAFLWFFGTVPLFLLLTLYLMTGSLKNWGWTLQVSVEHLWQNALNDTGSVHPLGDWHPSHSTQNLVQLILCTLFP